MVCRQLRQPCRRFDDEIANCILAVAVDLVIEREDELDQLGCTTRRPASATVTSAINIQACAQRMYDVRIVSVRSTR